MTDQHKPDRQHKAGSHDAAPLNEPPRPLEGAGLPPTTETPPSDSGESLSDLLAEIARALSRYVYLPEGAATAVSLWVLHTWAVEASYYTPRILLSSPTVQCGKSRVMGLLKLMCHNPKSSSSATAATIYRRLDQDLYTWLLDEADGYLPGNETMRHVIDAGFERDGVADRCTGDRHTPTEFPCFSAMAIAGIGQLHPSITSRSIVISMTRKPRAVRLPQLRMDKKKDWEPLRNKCEAWATSAMEALADADPDVPDTLGDRAKDCWRPLLAIADLAGGPWPERARRAAVRLHHVSGKASEVDLGTAVLADIRTVFDKQAIARLSSAEITRCLAEMEDRPWPEYSHGRAITPPQLAKLLREFDISPQTVRLGNGSTPKGYYRDDFEEAWRNYLG